MLPRKLEWPLAQTQWAQQLDPVVSNPLIQGQLLSNIALVNGTTVVNHKLGRKLQGWFPVLQSGAASLFDNQMTNQTPALTLSITSNAAVTVSLWVF